MADLSLREALGILHRAGRIRSPSMDGMVYNTELFGRPCRVREHSGVPLSGPGQPDTSDPATVGCLMALDREARGAPHLCSDHHVDHERLARAKTPEERAGAMWWTVFDADTDREGPNAKTEGEAWAADIVALAEVHRG